MTALGIGLYWAWMLVVCFSSTIFLHAVDTNRVTGTCEFLSFCGYIAMIALVVVLTRFVRIRWTQLSALLVSFVSCAGTLLMAFSPLMDVPTPEVWMFLGAVLTGLGTGVFLLSWGYQYARNIAYEPIQITSALVVCAATYFCVTLLPFEALAVVAALMPVVSGVLCFAASRVNGQPEVVLEPRKEGERPYPHKLAFALAATGLAFGCVLGLSFETPARSGVLAIDCAIVDVVLAAVIAGYSRFAKKNIGFSSINLAVMPLVGAGLLVLVGFSDAGGAIAVLLVRAGYALIDMVVWLQLPRAFAASGDIRMFVNSRFFLEGGSFLGVVLVNSVNATAPFLNTWVLVAVGAIVMMALSVAFASGGAENGWGMIPDVRPANRSFRLHQICHGIAEEFHLTKRESEVMMLLMRGNNGPYIQEKLCISQNTFQTHMRNLYHKCDIHSRQELLFLLDERMGAMKGE